MTMVEKMARAACEQAGKLPDERAYAAGVSDMKAWELWEDAALAMLAAMGEPTDTMLDAGRDHFFRNHPFGAKGIWSAMIDAAVAEPVSPPK